MDLAAVQETFHHWVRALDENGLSATHAYSFDSRLEGLVVVTFLTAARIDPERRAHFSGRCRAANLPLARLHYVLAVCGTGRPSQAEQVLLSLLVEAERHPAIQLLPDPVSATWWLAHGIAPRPSFQIEASVTEPVPGPVTPPIRDHSVDMSPLAVIQGEVISAAGHQIPGAVIHLDSTGQIVHSDRHGRFQLSSIDQDMHERWVRVQVRDQEQKFYVADVMTQEGHWLLRMSEPRRY